jgi:large subunit ribosomal protein L13
MLRKTPERVMQIAVKGMLPKNPLGSGDVPQAEGLRGPEHQHTAQQPKPLELS